jgi:hypothetical protein
MIKAANDREAIYATAEHLERLGPGPSTSDQRKPSETALERAAKLKSALEAKHRPIADDFCSDAGIHLQRQDSEMIAMALEQCLRRDLAALPYHDALLAPKEDIECAAAILHDAMRAKFGLRHCEIRIK